MSDKTFNINDRIQAFRLDWIHTRGSGVSDELLRRHFGDLRPAMTAEEAAAVIDGLKASHNLSFFTDARKILIETLTRHALSPSSEKLAEAVNESMRWQDRYNREVLGLNNEGDYIAGVPGSGLKDRLESAERSLAEANAKIAELEAKQDHHHRQSFIDHLQQAASVVASWPEWKRRVWAEIEIAPVSKEARP